MNRNRVKGTIDRVVGGVKRKAGELTGDTPLRIKGIAQQVKGTIESALGKASDVVNGTHRGSKVKQSAHR
jgi:uncharacterized protein YjbJ (UPF0337 family)